MLFNDLCYEWLEWKKPFVKSKTYETYYGTFVNQIEPFLKKVRCSAVNEDFLNKYSVAVQTSTLNRFNRRPSKNVASKAFQVIKSIISYGQRHHKLRYFEYKFQYVKDFENPMRQDMLRRRFNTLMKHLEITGISKHHT